MLNNKRFFTFHPTLFSKAILMRNHDPPTYLRNRIQAFRAAQNIIPDLRAELPDDCHSGGGAKRTYIEVKTVSGLSQWYLPVWGDRAVERRNTVIKRRLPQKQTRDTNQTDSGLVTQRLDQIGPIHPAHLVGLVRPVTWSTNWWP